MTSIKAIFIYLVISLSSTTWANATAALPPLEALQSVLPEEISLRPKLSLKENLSTVFAELEDYINTRTPLPDSNHLTLKWTARQDRHLLEVLIQHRDLFIPEGALALQTYFTARLKKASNEKVSDLWNHYTLLSTLFPDSSFWLEIFELALTQGSMKWDSLGPLDWTVDVLLPAVIRTPSSKKEILWNKNLLQNLISLAKHLETAGPAPLFLSSLEQVDRFYTLADSRWSLLVPSEAHEIALTYYRYLQSLITPFRRAPLLTALSSRPAFESTVLESIAIFALASAQQERKIQWLLTHPRFQNFFNRRRATVSWLYLRLDQLNEIQRFRQALSTVIYLRALLTLQGSLSLDPMVILKGSWIAPRQFQKNQELEWSEDLFKAHTEALRILQLTLYSQSLIDKCYREQLQTSTCHKWRESLPLQWKDTLSPSGRLIKTWSLVSKVPLILPPGFMRFAQSESLYIEAPELMFDWLSLIEIPSGQVEIHASSLRFPWINVSGESGSQSQQSEIQRQQGRGERPWVKNAKYCTPKDYLEGVQWTLIPRMKKEDWVGFSIKNPFPKEILVCSSHAQAESRDKVADITAMLDLGKAPKLFLNAPPSTGQPGGTISLDLNFPNLNPSSASATTDVRALEFPLLQAMGGDGSPGVNGLESPLCQRGHYKSFKIGLSHHKENFQQWIQAQTQYPHLQLIQKEEVGDHWYGLFEINLPRTSGSDAGNAGAGGEIKIKADARRLGPLPHRWFLSQGVPGLGGQAALCGPNSVQSGKHGATASPGVLELLKKP